jgi:hypothetical protein
MVIMTKEKAVRVLAAAWNIAGFSPERNAGFIQRIESSPWWADIGNEVARNRCDGRKAPSARLITDALAFMTAGAARGWKVAMFS